MESIVRHYLNTNLTEAQRWSESALDIAKRSECRKEHAAIYNVRAIAAISMGETDLAFQYIDSSIAVNRAINDQDGLSNSIGNKGTFYFYSGKYEESLEHHLQALEIDEKLGDKNGIATTLANIFGIYHIQKDQKKALSTGKRALQAFRELESKDGEALMLANLGALYEESNNADSAFWYLTRAERIFREINHPEGIADCYRMFSDIMLKEKEYNQALQHLDSALVIYRNIGAEHKETMVYSHIVPVYLELGNYNKAIEMALLLGERGKTQGSLQFQRDAMFSLMKAHRALKNYKEALEYSDEYHRLQDEILGEATVAELNKLKTQFEVHRKEQELAQYQRESEILKLNLERQTNYLVMSILILVLLVAGGVFVMRTRKLRNESLTIQLEQRLLRSQMNPHFIFNSLTAIQSFFYKNDPKEAGRFLSSFAHLIRTILDNSRTEYIVLSKEVAWLENYLKLQMLRFENRFSYEIHLGESLNTDLIQIPPMLIQPFVENALEHGFSDIDYLGKLDVFFSLQDDKLRIIVEDNGKGIQDSKIRDKKHVSVATEITRERLKLLNKGKSEAIEFSIEPRRGGGIRVDFKIPVQ